MIWSPNIETVESGNIAVTNFPATQPVSGTVSVGNFPAVQPINDNGGSITVDGTVSTTTASASTATVTLVSVSPVVATLAASNASRIKLIIHNETGTLFVKLGTGASSSSYSYRLTANAVLELTQYTGDVTGTKLTGTTNALVTEL